MEAEALLRPVVQAQGFELYDLRRRREAGRAILQVVVDAPDGIDVDELARLSRSISERLDAEDPESGTYDLQVCTPGIERALSRPEHYRRCVGEQVRVKTKAQVEGSRTHTGTLIAADDEGCTLATGDAELRVPYAGITSARTIVDWSAELKRSNA